MAVVLRHALFEVTAIPLKQKVIGAALLELTLDVQMPHGRRALRRFVQSTVLLFGVMLSSQQGLCRR